MNKLYIFLTKRTTSNNKLHRANFLTNLNFFPIEDPQTFSKKKISKRELQNPRTFINPNKVSLPTPLRFREPFQTNR